MIVPSTTTESFTFDTRATYQIIVKGRIDPAWSDRLEDLSLRQNSTKFGLQITCLEGEIVDQASLIGVMNTLYELHLTVLSVLRLDI